MNGEVQARRLAERVLRLSGAPQTEVSVHTVDSALTRFANNEIHQNVAERDTTVSVLAAFGNRYGSASTNDLSDARLQATAERALEIARALPDLPDFLPLPEGQPQPRAEGYCLRTAEFGALQRAVGVRTICRLAQDRGLTAAGAFRVDVGERSVANSRGLWAHHGWTSAELMAVVMGPDSSGYAARLAVDAGEIEAESIADEAVGKALQGRNPRTIPPGEYEVVLEEYAASDLLDFLGYTGLGALSVQEGRSFMSGRVGQKVLGSNISLWDDPLDPRGIVRPFDCEGVPASRVDLIGDGVALSPVYDRRTGVKDGKSSTGHALPPEYGLGPIPMNMFLGAGDATKEQLIQSVKRGLLITRFWYTRVVHPLTVHMTGMTRDGTFLIENGEVVAPVRDLRFTESYVQALNRVDRLGKETKLVRDFFAVNSVPAVKIAAWSFTGTTSA